ncbi:hypothetical protein T10_4026 [Trichinella papuae]|uniref:Uncharacterized protein n=1 Tax=Trichinella papuae TaxID=268474 RepID=A0A0V1M2S1_9BILA|nr:hypothetical protein T10_4026 [Trichinella papuae]
MVDRQKVAMEFKNGRGVGWEKTALGDRKCRGDFAEKAARGGKMLAKLFGGKLPLARKNSAGIDFVERKRHRAEKKPLWLIGRKPPSPKKWKGCWWGENSTGVDKM